ncbi:MAG: ribonuclease III [Oscillospiraceae bacterium]|jgi:ribonuclease-3|nr:ribonuclease III [Oscillospiraceae bacterium]
MEGLEQKIGYVFKDRTLLAEALTHRSRFGEQGGEEMVCNERLEFLGDSILGFVVAEYLFINRPGMPEGSMTKLRAELVCEKALYEVAASIDLGRYMVMSHGEEVMGGRKRPSLLADAMEAIFAAVHLDGGAQASRDVIHWLIISRLEDAEKSSLDYKSELQEYAQSVGRSVYYVPAGEHGPAHRKKFRVEVRLGGRSVAFGEGSSKKAAEKAAARAALERFEVQTRKTENIESISNINEG